MKKLDARLTAEKFLDWCVEAGIIKAKKDGTVEFTKAGSQLARVLCGMMEPADMLEFLARELRHENEGKMKEQENKES